MKKADACVGFGWAVPGWGLLDGGLAAQFGDVLLDALLLEDGLSRNTLAAYRRDLTAFARWLAREQPPLALDATAEVHLQDYFAARVDDTKATSSNRRLTVLLSRAASPGHVSAALRAPDRCGRMPARLRSAAAP